MLLSEQGMECKEMGMSKRTPWLVGKEELDLGK